MNFPKDAIICRFKDGRYRIFHQGTVWSSLNVAMKDLDVKTPPPELDPNVPMPKPLPVKENRSPSLKTGEIGQGAKGRNYERQYWF